MRASTMLQRLREKRDGYEADAKAAPDVSRFAQAMRRAERYNVALLLCQSIYVEEKGRAPDANPANDSTD